jgi:hypothetical protein
MTSATSVSTRAPIDCIPPDGGGTRDWSRTLRIAIAWTLLALVAFLLLQTLLAAYNDHVVRDALNHKLIDEIAPWEATIVSRLLPGAIPGAIVFVTLAVGGLVIARRGPRLLFAVPAIAYIFASVVTSPHVPQPIGFQWGLECFDWDVTYTSCAMPWFEHPWFGPTVDLALVLVPGFMIARRVRPRRWPGRPDIATLAAILTCAAAAATAIWAMAVIQLWVDLRPVAAVTAVGFLLGAARPWWPWLHVLIAVALASGFEWLLSMIFWPEPDYPLNSALPHILGETWPIVAIGLLAAAWQPLAWLIRRLQDRPLRMVVAVNVLNVADAVFTFLAVQSGGAYESNPIVRAIGLPLKLALVAAITLLLYRRKPSALVWPFAALLWVVAYHVAGIFVNAWH